MAAATTRYKSNGNKFNTVLTYKKVLQEKGPHVDQERFESKTRPPLTERNICVRWLCCACCLPVWARWVLWFIIVSIIIVIIVLAALLATFTMPTIDFAGVTSSPTNQSEISYNGHVLNFNFGLLIHIANPNVLGIDLSQINATVCKDSYTITKFSIFAFLYRRTILTTLVPRDN